jgi:hypothetical protein
VGRVIQQTKKPRLSLAALAGLILLAVSLPASAHHHHGGDSADIATSGLANATLIIVRHAEKADFGPDLSPAGAQRARFYARYFRPFVLGRQQLRMDALVAAADSNASHRARETLEPLSRALSVPIQQPFEDRDVRGLADWLGRGRPGRTILIAWHHGDLPRMIGNFGVDPASLLPHGNWPGHVYDWVIVLRFDSSGAVMRQASGLIHEPPTT